MKSSWLSSKEEILVDSSKKKKRHYWKDMGECTELRGVVKDQS